MELKENHLPDDESLVRLYNDAGWFAYTDDLDSLKRAIQGSLYLLCAYEEGQLVGLLRAVGDGVSILYIQDLLVLGAQRRGGIGTALIEHTIGRFASVRQKVVSTDDTPALREFYRRLGFVPYGETGLVGFYYMAKA
ncbi:MAG: GNAT family N-acetyltransferase [Christensenellaceae bacterium]|nr:GNAT family N-acetyltransferase [Christensenellaceae bacterium]